MGSRDSTAIEVRTPQLLTRAVQVESTSQETREVTEDVLAPDGWEIITGRSHFTLNPAQRDLRILCLHIPASASPGHYSVPYTLRDRSDSTVNSQCRFEIVVLAAVELQVAVDRVPQRVLAGDRYVAEFSVTNRGNTSADVRLTVRSSSGFPARLSRSSLRLHSSQSLPVEVAVEIAKGVRDPFTNLIVLEAQAMNVPSAQVTACATTEVLPRPAQGGDLYHRVPSRLTTRFVSGSGKSGFQTEYSGSGSLDSREAYKVEYLLRGPRDFESYVFGLRDEYYLAVRSPHADVRVGDQVFSLSSLTENHRLGRGAKAALAKGPFTAGAYSFTSRSKYPDLEEWAAYAGWSHGQRYGGRVNVLNKKSGDVRRHMLAISAAATPNRNVDFTAEYGLGQRERAEQKAAHAVAVRVNGKLKRTRLTLEEIYADRDFPGYYRDQNLHLASLYVPLRPRLQWQGSYQSIAQNLGRDSVRSPAMRETRMLTGVSWTLPVQCTATLNLEDVRRRDALNPALYDDRESTVALRLRQPVGNVVVSSSAEGGRRLDYRNNESAELQRYRVAFDRNSAAGPSFGASFQIGNFGSRTGATWDRTVGLSAAFRVRQRLTVAVSLQKTSDTSPAMFGQDQFALDARYVIFRQHVISLKVRDVTYRRDGIPDGKSLAVSYEIPFGLPVGRRTEVGRVKGRVFDADHPRQPGLSDVVLSLDGLMAMTDKKGNFSFPSVTPGIHYLQLDKSTVGVQRLATCRSPLEMDVRGGKTQSLSIGVTRAATVEGEVNVFGLVAQGSSRGLLTDGDSGGDSASVNAQRGIVRLYGLADAELILWREGEAIRAVTDRNGRFSIAEVRPGRWKLAVLENGLPPFHELEQQTVELVIGPGRVETVDFRVLPQRRSLHVVGRGRVSLTKSPRR